MIPDAESVASLSGNVLFGRGVTVIPMMPFATDADRTETLWRIIHND